MASEGRAGSGADARVEPGDDRDATTDRERGLVLGRHADDVHDDGGAGTIPEPPLADLLVRPRQRRHLLDHAGDAAQLTAVLPGRRQERVDVGRAGLRAGPIVGLEADDRAGVLEQSDEGLFAVVATVVGRREARALLVRERRKPGAKAAAHEPRPGGGGDCPPCSHNDPKGIRTPVPRMKTWCPGPD